jgi:hypothetical protein
MSPDTLVGCFIIAGCLAIVFAALWIRALYVCRGHRQEARDWYEACREAEEERDESDKIRADAVQQLLVLSGQKFDHEAEVKYLSTLADASTDRNMALQMHVEVRKWRENFWNNTIYQLVFSLFHEKDGERDSLGMALRAEWDRETEELIERARKITNWPGIPVRQSGTNHLSEEVPCEPSSSPEDSGSSEAT